jgi:hypothetical protein
LLTTFQQEIANALVPALNSTIHAKIPRRDQWSLRPDETDPYKQTLLFDYPSWLPPEESGQVLRSVKIEMGAEADRWPCETKPVTPSVAEQFPQAYRQATCELMVLSADILGEADHFARGVSSPRKQTVSSAVVAPLLRFLRVDSQGSSITSS